MVWALPYVTAARMVRVVKIFNQRSMGGRPGGSEPVGSGNKPPARKWEGWWGIRGAGWRRKGRGGPWGGGFGGGGGRG